MNKKIILVALMTLLFAIIVIILFAGNREKDNKFLDLEGLSCDEMLAAYDSCVKYEPAPVGVPQWEVTRACREYYVDKIVECYGEDILRDQLALINQSD